MVPGVADCVDFNGHAMPNSLPPPRLSQHRDNLDKRHLGTGQWLLSSNEYQNWLQTSQQILFYRGIPGVGETILTAIVIKHRTKKFERDPTVGISYAYCSYHRREEQNEEHLLLSLLRQLSETRTSLPTGVRKLYNDAKDKRNRPSMSEIISTLRDVTPLYERAFIVVDGIDECQEAKGCRKVSWTNCFNSKRKGRPISTSRHNLHLAVRCGLEDAARTLLCRNDHVDINTMDLFGMTVSPVNRPAVMSKNLLTRTLPHVASESGHASIAELLLSKGADIEFSTNDIETPLHLASGNGCLSTAELLLSEGADIEFADIHEWTPLLIASENRTLSITKLLLRE
ncbi:hypothetical protein QQS21_010409 [Conoideocrella luteorostrata]|uniref:Nephrocystin 3-like N-terminal domain-containing protein n=1 Tax=Conoideocrella luteorostrata TaxID=1105319 RepID=A0AAJ0FWW1_9HYPO|nr:hypothetical protein QQS21_010409 [Conoideocrella luteorostrata]